MHDNSRTNGFRIRTLNQDCDRLAVQSTVQTTWFCSYKGQGKRGVVHEVGIAQKELVILRPYQGKPVFELEGLGGDHGVLIVQEAAGSTRTLRNGQKVRYECTGSIVIKTENFAPPGREGVQMGAV
jgi:hypothetical protein